MDRDDDDLSFSLKQITQACRNIGYDLTCGECASIFFTGYSSAPHDESCQTVGRRPRGEVIVDIPGDERIDDEISRRVTSLSSKRFYELTEKIGEWPTSLLATARGSDEEE